uniref:RING-type domain-containing protein n=1 Tax=Denticeps clupeoides TaxID=299321 RepID=A0AAY4E5L9_9TELE
PLKMETLLMKESPLLLPLNKQKTVYDGFITVQVGLLGAGMQVISLSLFACFCSLKRLQRSSDLGSFILELKTVLEVALKNRPDHVTIPPPQYYSQLIAELESLGWDKLLFIDTEFCTLRLKGVDSSGHEHVLTVKLKPKYPFEAPEYTADLPVPFSVTWTLQSTLAHIHKRFLAELEGLAEFWSVLDEIDVQTWVLEPEKPSRADTMRRIAIGNNVSIKVEIDPRHPRMLPDCCLLGAEHGGNPDCGVLQNLKDVLEIEFPSPATHEKSSLSTECGICYSFRLESAIPDQVCNDPRCGQPFHQACLYEWLRGLPTSRQSFNTVFGECPYCSKPITVKTAVHKQ